MQTPVRKILLLLLVVSSSQLAAFSQYWQQQVNYRIDVTLDDKQHSLTGFARMEYINNSPDTLRFIWFHLWPNAYKNDKTAFSDQLLENGNTKFYFSNKEEKGYINRLDFKVDNITAALEDHPQHIDIAKLVLPAPLAPGKRITITTPFHVRLPYNYSRGGHDGQSYQATQWYPKPAVYDQKGWHPMPYLDQGEFYSEFGNFEVQVTVPKNYVVAATGELQDAPEKEWLASRKSFTWEPIKHKEKIKGGGVKTTVQLFPESSNETKTLRFLQQNVHDFAWFADKRFIVEQDSMALSSGRVIRVFSYYTPAQKEHWSKSVQYTKQAVRFYSSMVGEYPYDVVSVVQGPDSFGGGMEYPTITILSPTDDGAQLDRTIAHEVGHNWFYGILASNERDHPWMDEGINSFYDADYAGKKDDRAEIGEKQFLQAIIAEKKDQPIATRSEDFSETNYALIAYYKTGRWVAWLEKELGKETFDKAMREYYRRWQFKHPQPEDLKKVFEDVSGRNLDAAFALLYQKGELPGEKRKGVGFRGPLGVAHNKHADKREAITLHPMGGFNSYDKLMVGATLTNLRLPLNRIQFWLTPMYGIGSKTFTGIGFAKFVMNPDGVFRKIDIGVNAAAFSADRFTDENGKKTFLGFRKIAPGIRLTFKEKSARSTFHRFIQFKSFLISEDGLRFWRDTIITPTDTIIVNNYGKTKENRTLHQLKFVIENNRALYPYRGELKIEQGEDFVRTAFTGNYFFNYPKEGGLNVRLFAGKFFYTSSKTIGKQFATDRYHLNMTGPNGYEDYTYSDYFVGRNHFEGLASQQIMLRDGAFKVRTDLLADKVGRTDDWLIAANFTTNIPSAINPLSVLPIKIPLKLFVDIGTYADAWKPGAGEDRFLYDAGLQVSLFKETVNIYLPLLYSRVFKDYIQSTIEKKGRLWKTVSFTIDISNFSARKIDRNFDL
jgi:hypothetical protein